VGRQKGQVRSRQCVRIGKLVRRQAAAVRIAFKFLGGQRGSFGLCLVLCPAQVLQKLGVAVHDDLAHLTQKSLTLGLTSESWVGEEWEQLDLIGADWC
jgi:hypothetical protein